MYRNERECGQAIKSFLTGSANSSGLKREDIHFTTKLASNSSYERARKSIDQSVKECGLGYIDLFLLHSPYGGRKVRLESWKAVEDAIDAGEVKSGGVSNFGVKHVCITKMPPVIPMLMLLSSKSFWQRSLDTDQSPTKSRFTPLTHGRKSPLSARQTTLSSRHMPRLYGQCA